MKSLYPDVNWDLAQVIGFDMDGTLYDELSFIEQVYVPISRYLAEACGGNENEIYAAILQRWKEKGSSYPYIYSELLNAYRMPESEQRPTISECLRLYRHFKPCLKLSDEVVQILAYFRDRYPLFLVTDGNPVLQSSKIAALGLHAYFTSENMGLTGAHGACYSKPSINILGKIETLEGRHPSQIVYFGDRSVDKQFAANAGFQFVSVKCMRV